jgi:hypothetical protein
MRHNVALTLGLCAFAAAAVAQEPNAPTPGPEHKKLAYYAGNWKTDADLKAMGPFAGGKVTGTGHGEMIGGFFMVTRASSKSPMGSVDELEIMGYDAKEGVYTYDGFNSSGEHETYKGTVEGDTWTWTGSSNLGGQTVKGRFVAKATSASSYTFRFDYSPDGSSWVNVMEGKATKTD